MGCIIECLAQQLFIFIMNVDITIYSYAVDVITRVNLMPEKKLLVVAIHQVSSMSMKHKIHLVMLLDPKKVVKYKRILLAVESEGPKT